MRISCLLLVTGLHSVRGSDPGTTMQPIDYAAEYNATSTGGKCCLINTDTNFAQAYVRTTQNTTSSGVVIAVVHVVVIVVVVGGGGGDGDGDYDDEALMMFTMMMSRRTRHTSACTRVPW